MRRDYWDIGAGSQVEAGDKYDNFLTRNLGPYVIDKNQQIGKAGLI
jgi:hypothetical protein